MALKIKIDPIERVTVASLVGQTLGERKRAAATFAREGIADADQINQRILGRVPPRTITVDGKHSAPLESVNPDGGQIVVEYELIVDVLRWIATTLRERSPVVSGAYRDAHTLFVDGKEIPLGETIPPASEYVFLNPVPYARKIEIGKTNAGRAFVVQVPNRVYERTAKDAKSRFGNLAEISFAYRQQSKGYALRRAQGRRRGRQVGDVISSPAIIVKLRAA